MKKWVWVVAFLFMFLIAAVADRGCRAEEPTGAAQVGSPQLAPVTTPLEMRFMREPGKVASCDTCRQKMTAPLPHNDDPDVTLSNVSMFPCFNCGEIHLIAQVAVKTASGSIFTTGSWMEWVWDKKKKEWRARK